MPRYTYVPLSQALSEIARTTPHVVIDRALRAITTRWNHVERRPMTPEEEDMAPPWMGPIPIRTADLAAWAREAESRGELTVGARVAVEGVIVDERRRPILLPWNGDLHIALADDWWPGEEVRQKLIAALETYPDLRAEIEAALAATGQEPDREPAPEVEHPDRYARMIERG